MALVVHGATPAVKVRMGRHYETRHRAAYSESVAEMQEATKEALERLASESTGVMRNEPFPPPILRPQATKTPG
ncbi:hypothetical protein GCM10023223_09270 [Stackebrandtia albiflava]